jgi:hypothetical protein
MAAKNQVSVGSVHQVFFEVRRQNCQNIFLARYQAAVGIRRGYCEDVAFRNLSSGSSLEVVSR